MTSSVQLLLAALVLLLPGAGLLLALGIRDRVTLLGAAAPCTVGLALLAAMLLAVLDIGFSAATFAVLAVLAIGAVVVLRHVRRGRRSGESVELEAVLPDHGAAELNDIGALTARIVGWLAGAGAVGLGSWTWLTGMGSWSTPTQEHDPILHSVATAFIHFTGNAAPWQLVPVDLLSQSPVSFYPSGFPAMSALVADLVGSPMTGMNLMTVAALAVAWPMSAAAFAAVGVRAAGFGRGWTDLAGGVAALIAAVLYRPAFAFAHDGGILPNAMALVLVPGLLAALLAIGRRQWGRAMAVGIACAGVGSIHPSAAASVALSVAVIWAAALLTARGRHHLREVFVPLALTAVVALVALIPTLLGSAKSAGTVSSWAPDVAAQSPPDAVGRTLTMAYGGYFDASFTLTQLSLAVLTLGGLIVALLTRRGWVVVAPWALWVAISIDFQMSPASGIGSAIGTFFYRSATRISAHTYVFSPAVVGFGAVAILCWMTDRVLHTQGAEAGRPDRTAKAAVPVLVCTGLALIMFFVTTLVGYAKANAHTVAQRYSEPQFTRYDMDDRAAVAWLRDNARPGERIMNNANDGSTLAYVEDGLPIINDHSMGLLDSPYTIDLLARFNNYPQDQQIRSLLLKLNIAWVYVDSQAPAIGDNAQGRLGGPLYTVAPGLARLTNLPGLTRVFTSGHVSIYHLTLGEVSALNGS